MSLIIPANTLASGGYEVANSVRLNDGSSDYFNRSPSSAGNTKKFTISFWLKRGTITGADQNIFHAFPGSGSRSQILFNSSEQLLVDLEAGNTNRLITTRLFRDTSAWYHIVIVYDSDNGTSGNRVIIYINGVRETSFGTETYPSSGSTSQINTTTQHEISSYDGSGSYFDGYLAEFVLLDGTVADATSFGEFDEDSGIWKPIDVSGLTFGTNGFYLDFENSGALGADVSGNTNNFTVNNLTAIDQSTDTCTNNFATWNPLDNFYQSNTYSEGNLQVQTQSTSFTYNSATIGVSTGKWYWEVEYDAKSGGTDQPMIGITSTQPTANDNELGNFPNDFAWYTDNGTGYLSNNNTYSNVGFNAYTVGDVISVALDLDNNKLYFAKNGTWEKSGNPESGSTGTGAISITATASTPLGVYFPSVGDATNSQNATFKTNFGSPPYSESGGETDGNGYGNFAHAVPSGYYALNTKNLAEYG